MYDFGFRLSFFTEIITESIKTEKTEKTKDKKEKTEKIEDVANDVDAKKADKGAKKEAEPEKEPEKPKTGDPPVIDGKLEDVVSFQLVSVNYFCIIR